MKCPECGSAGMSIVNQILFSCGSKMRKGATALYVYGTRCHLGDKQKMQIMLSRLSQDYHDLRISNETATRAIASLEAELSTHPTDLVSMVRIANERHEEIGELKAKLANAGSHAVSMGQRIHALQAEVVKLKQSQETK